jgi:hypothetical protein
MLSEVLLPESEFRAGLVVLSYRRPGAGDRQVSFGHATGMRAADGALDLVLMASTLRQIADQLDGLTKDPEALARAMLQPGAVKP